MTSSFELDASSLRFGNAATYLVSFLNQKVIVAWGFDVTKSSCFSLALRRSKL